MQNRVLLTGASGFTGSWLAKDLLKSGATLTALLAETDPESIFVADRLHERARCVYGSMLDYDLLARIIPDHGIDTVLHLGGIAVESKAYDCPRASFEVNVRGTYNLMDACRRNADLVTRIVVASSDKVYGDTQLLPYEETLPVQGLNPYDCSKSCCDLIAHSYHHGYGMPIAIGRFANIYGGGDLNWSRIVPNTIRRLLRGERPLVRYPKPGQVYRRDFLYIKDQVRAYRALLNGLNRPRVHGQAYNFGMGDCIAVSDIVLKIQRILGLEHLGRIEEMSTRSEIINQQLSAEKARRDLEWEPIYTIDSGLEETVKWYINFLSNTSMNLCI